MFCPMCITMTTLSRATKRHSGILLGFSFTLFCNFHENAWPGCFRVFSKDEEGAIPADEIKWSIFAWNSMITLSKVCNVCYWFIWFPYLMCLFVQICTDASTWDQGQGETALLVSQKWRDTLSTSYLIFVIFFTLAKFLENKIYTEKRQFFALNL